MRKTLILLIYLLFGLGVVSAEAQLNKNYFFWRGRSFLIDNKYDAAIETLNVLLRVDAELYEAYFLRGIAKYNLDDLLGAEHDFSMAIQKNPVYTMAYQYRAITRSRLGNYDDALRDFQEAIDLRPDIPGPYFSRGVTYLLSQQFDKAIQDFDQFIRYENKISEAYINRGTAYLFMKDTVRAYEEYNTAIRTNREDPNGYNRRGMLRMVQKNLSDALSDFDKALECDSSYLLAYFNRALVYNEMNRPMDALQDFDRVIELDSTNALTYFNRAILRSKIGDYNRALDDYNQVAFYSPNNVLVYYNRASLHTWLGDLDAAVADYTRAIELYPDFANAYLERSKLRYFMRDERGSQSDRHIAETKIAEYRSKLTDSTFSIYADTSRTFNQLLSFDNSFSRDGFRSDIDRGEGIKMMPLFKFTLLTAEEPTGIDPKRYYVPRLELFKDEYGNRNFDISARESDLPLERLMEMDALLDENLATGDWLVYFKKSITQSLIKQYTNAVSLLTKAIELNPSNPFLYINRSTVRSEMIDFISSIENSYQRITIDSDPANMLRNSSARTYNYDEAISDLNKAIKLFPEFAYAYYNRANLYAQSGMLPEAFDDYTRAIELWPNFAEAYFNRGLVQIYLKDTRKGCLDISKSGELGIREAYEVLRRFSPRPE